MTRHETIATVNAKLASADDATVQAVADIVESMTPHSSSRSDEAIDRRFMDVAANLDALAGGGALRNVVLAP